MEYNKGRVPCIGPSSSSSAIILLAKLKGGKEWQSMGAESLERDDAWGVRSRLEGMLPAP